MQYCLVGEVPGVTKDKLLQWGATSGHVKMILDGGVTIKRDLVTSGAEFKNAQGSKVHGTTAVNNAVKTVFGLDKDLARQAIFVRQTEIDAVLFETAAKREQSFQKLCGMGQASTIHRKIGEIVADKFKTPPNYDEQVAIAKQKLEENQQRLVELNNSLPILPDDEEILKTKTLFTVGTSLLTKLSKLDSIGAELLKNQDILVTLAAELETLQANKDTLDAAELDIAIDGAKQFMNEVKAYQAAKNKLTNALSSSKVNKPEVNEDQLAALEADYAKAYQVWTTARANYASLKGIFDAIAKSDIGTCPVCHSVIADPDKVKAELKSQLSGFATLVSKDPATMLTAINRSKAALEAYNRESAKASMLLEACQKEMAAFPEALDIDVNTIIAEINALEQSKRAIQKAKEALISLTTKQRLTQDLVDRKVVEFATLENDIKTRSEELWGTYTGSAELASLLTLDISANEVKIDSIASMANERSRMLGTIEELTYSIKTLGETIADLEVKRVAAANYSQVMKTLTGVRDWFHYSNGPRTLSTGIINDMTGDINNFLDKLEAPFSVVPSTTDGLAFQCVFHDGRATGAKGLPDAEDLSGGQKVLLATAFRLSSYCMFASSLGLLSLDEPSCYLDSTAVTNMGAFFASVKDIAKALNLQIFIATHEKELMEHMDTIIDLG